MPEPTMPLSTVLQTADKDPVEAIRQLFIYFTEIFDERVGGATVGDVFTVGDDEILTLSIGDGLEKSNGSLQVTKAATQADASVAHAITDPADAPANADALRDDLVANAIPDIEAALDALGTKVNEIIDKLQAANLMT